MSQTKPDRDSGRGYREILTVFLAVAITAMATRAGEVADRAAELCRAQLWEIILFCIFYTVFRIKWYLDDIREDQIYLPDKKEIERLQPRQYNGISTFALPFAMASWVFWLVAAFYVPYYMCWAYGFLIAGILMGTFAVIPLGKLKHECPCCQTMTNFFCMIFLIAAGMGNELVAIIFISAGIALVIGEALKNGSFIIKVEKSDDREKS